MPTPKDAQQAPWSPQSNITSRRRAGGDQLINDAHHQCVHCPACDRPSTRAGFTDGQTRMCSGCGTLYVQPPVGRAAEKGEVKAFNAQASRVEAEVFLMGRSR